MRFEIDPGATSRARRLLADDAERLRACASQVSAALAGAAPALGSAARLASAVGRFRLVEARALDAVAEAADALGGRIGTASDDAVALERSASSALGASAPPASGAAAGSRPAAP
jgi:hypothetical protein